MLQYIWELSRQVVKRGATPKVKVMYFDSKIYSTLLCFEDCSYHENIRFGLVLIAICWKTVSVDVETVAYTPNLRMMSHIVNWPIDCVA